MADLAKQFESAVADSRRLAEIPDNGALLQLYALYRQATSGDVHGQRPGFTDIVAQAKWDAWQKLAGTSSEDAMQRYVDLVDKLKRCAPSRR